VPSRHGVPVAARGLHWHWHWRHGIIELIQTCQWHRLRRLTTQSPSGVLRSLRLRAPAPQAVTVTGTASGIIMMASWACTLTAGWHRPARAAPGITAEYHACQCRQRRRHDAYWHSTGSPAAAATGSASARLQTARSLPVAGLRAPALRLRVRLSPATARAPHCTTSLTCHWQWVQVPDAGRSLRARGDRPSCTVPVLRLASFMSVIPAQDAPAPAV